MRHRSGKFSVHRWFLFLAMGAIGTLAGYLLRVGYIWAFVPPAH